MAIASGVTVASYTYDLDHNRLTQWSDLTGALVTTTYLPGVDRVLTAAGDVTWHSYVMAEGAAVGEIRRVVLKTGPTTVAPYYYLSDAQNSVAVITDQNGGSPENDAYDA